MKVRLMNKISQEGLKRLPADRYEVGEDLDHADAIMVRSASLHDAEFEPELKCIARAGAGVNNIPLDRCSEQGIVVFNTPGGNSNAVKELTIAGLLLASRKIVKGIEWVKTLDPEGIAKAVEKGKSQFAGPEIAGKKLGVIGLGAIGVQVGTCLLVSEECPIHENYKNAVIKAKDTDTVVTGRSLNSPVRILKNPMSRQYIKLEAEAASRDELEKLTLGGLRRAVFEGDMKTGSVMMGQIAGLCKEIRPLKDILDSLVSDIPSVLAHAEQALEESR